MGHLYKNCLLNKKESGGDKGKDTLQKNTQAQGSPPVGEEAANLARSEALPVPSKVTRKKQGKAPIGAPSPPLTRERVAVGAAFSMGMLNTNSSSVYSNVSPHCIGTSSDHFFLVQYFTHTFNPPKAVECPMKPSSPTISCTQPSFPDEPPPNSHLYVPPSHSSPPPFRYTTRARSRSQVPDSLGIGLITSPPPLKMTRGRPSSLSIAKLQAGEESIVGNQHSIDWVLRAMNTQELPPP